VARIYLPVISEGAAPPATVAAFPRRAAGAAATGLPEGDPNGLAQQIPGAVGRLSDPLLDNLERRVRYLRISVTDRCNFRCTYCRPEDDLEFGARTDLLTFEELERIVTVFAGLGVRKLRLTGGEPTVRSGVVELVGRLRRVPGIEQVVMTSNGALLGKLAAPLAAAGLSAVNVSIDTLDAERFARITKGQLAPVIAGIDAALAAGLAVKLNAVALADTNGDEIVALCRFAWERGCVPRFIEHMPMSGGALYDAGNELTAAQIRAAVERELGPLTPSPQARRDAGPARYWRLAGDPRREVGIISAMTEHFCGDCNRLRLTAAGDLHACLGHDDATSLRDIVRRRWEDPRAAEAELIAAIAAAVGHKRPGHEFQRTGAGAPGKHMISIGG
jgi:cyclic pyranopterin phosphate synthase